MNIDKYINQFGKDYKRLTFVSHKYANNPKQNIEDAEKVCAYLHRQGYIPVCPILLFRYMPNDKERDLLMILCHILILICPSFFIFHKSPGCKQELQWALQHKKRIEDFSAYKKDRIVERLSERELRNLMEKPEDIIVK